MRIKLFVLQNKDADEDEAVMLPKGWSPINVESEMGCVYVWAYEIEEVESDG